MFDVTTVSNQNLPVGFNIQATENHASYALLSEAVELCGGDINNTNTIFSSDRSKAGEKYAREALPDANQRFCDEHIIRNINENCGTLDEAGKSQVRACARALTKAKFSRAWTALGIYNPKAQVYLSKIPLSNWASYTFVERGIMTHGQANNNPSECEANRMLPARRKLSVLEEIVEVIKTTATAFNLIRNEVLALGGLDVLIPSAAAVLDSHSLRTQDYTAVEMTEGMYMVTHSSDRLNLLFKTVDTRKGKCSDGCWQDTGLPCVHAWTVQQTFPTKFPPSIVLLEWVSPMYRVESFKSAFELGIVLPAVETLEMGDELTLAGVVPSEVRGRGAPKHAPHRFTSRGEVDRFKKSKH
jgi:hypothetical protein